MLESGLEEVDALSAASRAFDVFFLGRNQVVFYDGALEVLQNLSQRYRLFALTNGNANIDRVGIGGYFEGAVSSADVGASKPDLKMFHAVLNRAGVAETGPYTLVITCRMTYWGPTTPACRFA